MPEEGEEWKEEEAEVWHSRWPSNQFFTLKWVLLQAILNERHEVIPARSTREWGEFMERFENRRVAETTLNGVWVSTVFLGLNHDYTGAGPGLWFETMVFPEKDKPSPLPDKIYALLDEMQLRYETWAEAEKGHATIVETIRYGLF